MHPSIHPSTNRGLGESWRRDGRPGRAEARHSRDGRGWLPRQTWGSRGSSWSSTSGSVFSGSPPPALGTAASARAPGPRRKGCFHGADLVRGKAAGLLQEEPLPSTEAPSLPSRWGECPQSQCWKTGGSELCFPLNPRGSSSAALIPGRRKSTRVLFIPRRRWTAAPGALLVRVARNSGRVALGLSPAGKEVLSPRMLERLTAPVNTTPSHSPEHEATDSWLHFLEPG